MCVCVQVYAVEKSECGGKIGGGSEVDGDLRNWINIYAQCQADKWMSDLEVVYWERKNEIEENTKQYNSAKLKENAVVHLATRPAICR